MRLGYTMAIIVLSSRWRRFNEAEAHAPRIRQSFLKLQKVSEQLQ